MALTILPLPAASLAALGPILTSTARSRAHALHASVAGVTPAQLTLPTPVYVLGIDSLTTGAGLAGVTLVGWRVIADKGAGAQVAVETSYDAPNNVHAFASLNDGPFVADTATQVTAARNDPRVAGGDYELRLLRIPALYVVALWLKDRRGADDIFVPLSPAQPPLAAGKSYSAADLEALLKAPAEARLKVDDRPKP